MTRRPGDTALAAAVRRPAALADPAEPRVVVAPCRDQASARKAAPETSEQVNVERDTP
jgi:hypothetical protein